jgi:hypothetical protein
MRKFKSPGTDVNLSFAEVHHERSHDQSPGLTEVRPA